MSSIILPWASGTRRVRGVSSGGTPSPSVPSSVIGTLPEQHRMSRDGRSHLRLAAGRFIVGAIDPAVLQHGPARLLKIAFQGGAAAAVVDRARGLVLELSTTPTAVGSCYPACVSQGARNDRAQFPVAVREVLILTSGAVGVQGEHDDPAATFVDRPLHGGKEPVRGVIPGGVVGAVAGLGVVAPVAVPRGNDARVLQ